MVVNSTSLPAFSNLANFPNDSVWEQMHSKCTLAIKLDWDSVLENLYDLNLKWVQNQIGVLSDIWCLFLTVSVCCLKFESSIGVGMGFFNQLSVQFLWSRETDWVAYKFRFGVYK